MSQGLLSSHDPAGCVGQSTGAGAVGGGGGRGGGSGGGGGGGGVGGAVHVNVTPEPRPTPSLVGLEQKAQLGPRNRQRNKHRGSARSLQSDQHIFSFNDLQKVASLDIK